jgi:transcriptional antiterminator RfaH
MFVTFEKGSLFWYKINYAYDVSKLLTICNEHYIVPNTLIAEMIVQYHQEGVLFPKKQLCKDNPVRLISGPFDNFLATLESIDEDPCVWVLMDLVGQKTRALVKVEKLKLAT